MAPSQVFFITGTSSGFGHAYVEEALKNGDRVIATSRDPSRLTFQHSLKSNLLVLPLDVMNEESIKAAFVQGQSHFGQIDVVVNNAGYGLTGAFETLGNDQIKKQFDVNFFGTLAVTRHALRVMREQGTGGLIQQVSSICGQVGVPAISVYCASKFAIEGWTEALAQEVKPEWNIKFNIVEPGAFQTNWSRGSMELGCVENAAYDHINAAGLQKALQTMAPGDPLKGVARMYELAKMPDPPLRVVLGSQGLKDVTAKIDGVAEGLKQWKSMSESTDVEKAATPANGTAGNLWFD